ncbi:hypothetical protein BSLG_007140 [Batrachochytrium salamandrivorans]|nr:hypothetical protein BSLG_007140 [Batrachochytrium salamandrivorans]
MLIPFAQTLIVSPKLFSNPTGRLVIALAVADFIDAANKLMGQAGPSAGKNSVICQLQAAMIQEGTLASIFISLSMTINALYVVFFNGSVSLLHKYAWVTIGLCFGLAIPLSIIPIFYQVPIPISGPGSPIIYTRMYQDAQQWCWISSKLPTFQIAFFYAELFFIFAFNSVAYVVTGIKLRQIRSHSTVKSRNASSRMAVQLMAQRMLLYTIGFVIAWTPSAVNRITAAVIQEPVFALSLLQSIVSPARGFINFLVFLQTKKQNIAAVTLAKKTIQHPSNLSTWGPPPRSGSLAPGVVEVNLPSYLGRASESHSIDTDAGGGGVLFDSTIGSDRLLHLPPSSHAMERRSMEFNRHSPIVRSNSPLSPMRDFSLGTPELFRSTAPSLHMSSSLGLRDSKDYDRIYSADHAMEGRADKNDNVSVLSLSLAPPVLAFAEPTSSPEINSVDGSLHSPVMNRFSSFDKTPCLDNRLDDLRLPGISPQLHSSASPIYNDDRLQLSFLNI